MKASSLFSVILVASFLALVGCTQSCGGSSPEDAVTQALEAMKAKNFEKVVGYTYLETRLEREFEETKGKSASENQKAKEIARKKLREELIVKLKANSDRNGGLVSFKILEVKERKEDSANVVVEIRDGKDQKEETFPVIKVGSKWLLNIN